MFSDSMVHCSGALGAIDGFAHVEHASARARACSRAVDNVALYDSFATSELQYGPGYRTIVQVWCGSGKALARLRSRSPREGTQVHVHPADLDDALCLGALCATGESSETRVPFAVDEVQLQGARGQLWAVRLFSAPR